MSMFKTKIKIGNKEKTVVVINHAKEKSQKENISVDCLHHIQLLDRSGSMAYEINGLIENVKKTIDSMSDEDYISIIWFSGEGQYKTLIKGARKDKSIYSLLDSIKSTIGCTCFSESLQEASDIVDELSIICPNFNITLFTDGEPCLYKHSEEEEMQLSIEIVNKMKEKIIALNTIGYGYNYDKDFLINLSNESMFGTYVHSNKIDEYMSIFSHNYEKISGLIFNPVEIKADNCKVLYLNSKTSKLANNEMKMSLLENKKNQFVIIGDNEFNFSYNEENYNSNDITKEPQESTLKNILYCYAYELFYNNKRKESLNILAKNLKDKYYVDNQLNAFTYDEISLYSKKLKKAVFKNKYRFLDGECSDNYIPDENSLCVIDILKLLTKNNNYYVYSKNYNRISMKSEDTFNLFEWDDKDHLTKIDELVLSEKELNVSLRSMISGITKINPKIAKANGIEEKIKSHIFRNQTLIKDGNLNMEEITIIADDTTKIQLETLNNENKGKLLKTVEKYDKMEDCHKIVINLSEFPIINTSYLKLCSNVDEIFDDVMKITNLKAEQKVLKYLIDLKKNEIVNTSKFSDLQLEVLSQHGLDKNLCYNGVNVKLAEKNENDYYMTRKLTLSIKGMASVPQVLESVNDTKNNKYKMYIKEKYKKYENLDVNILTEVLKQVKKDLLDLRLKINGMKIAKILSGDWFDNLSIDNKGNYFYEKDNNVLVIKPEKVKKYF